MKWKWAKLVSFLTVGLAFTALVSVLNIWAGAIVLFTIGLLVFAGFVSVPAAHYGVGIRLGKRTGEIFLEGLGWIFWLIEEVQLFDQGLATKIVSLSFFSRDGWEVIVKGLVQWRPDWSIFNSDGQNKFLENKPETVESGISEAIKSLVGNIIGLTKADDFRKKKKEVERYINSVLRLTVPPHVEPRKYNPQFLRSDEIAAPVARLKFYKDCSSGINAELREERNRPQEHSELEEMYGIDLVDFKMGDVDFSPDSKKSLEAKKQAVANMEAAGELEKRFQKIYQTILLENPGLDPEIALNKAMVLIGKGDQKVVSLEGLKGLFGGG